MWAVGLTDVLSRRSASAFADAAAAAVRAARTAAVPLPAAGLLRCSRSRVQMARALQARCRWVVTRLAEQELCPEWCLSRGLGAVCRLLLNLK